MPSRELHTDAPFDLRRSWAPLARGSHDPTTRVTRAEVWRATRTPDGPATFHLADAGEGRFVVEAWGEGAAWVLECAPDLIGAADEPPAPEDLPRPLREHARKSAGLRLVKTHRIYELLLPVVLEQLVTGPESKRAFTNLVREHGEPAPGPASDLMLPPDPRHLRRIDADAWLYLGILRKQGETLRRVAQKAHRLEEADTMSAPDAERRLTALPGIGPWTAGSVMLYGMGHADAVPVGDYHLPNTVAFQLAGEERADDVRMLELLEPYRGQRGRVVRMLETAGSAPRRGPRRPIRQIPGRGRRR